MSRINVSLGARSLRLLDDLCELDGGNPSRSEMLRVLIEREHVRFTDHQVLFRRIEELEARTQLLTRGGR